MNLNTATAKVAWKKFPRSETSVFPYSTCPALLELASDHIPVRSNVILFGGGRGYLGTVLKNSGRRCFNLDLGDVSQSFVPSLQADLERPLRSDAVALARGKRKVTLVSPFSFEYMDRERATANLVRLTKPGERWIWVSHHADSFVMSVIRGHKTARDVIFGLYEDLGNCPPENWNVLIPAAQRQIREVYSTFPDLPDISKLSSVEASFLNLSLDHSLNPVILDLIDALIYVRYASLCSEYVSDTLLKIAGLSLMLAQMSALTSPIAGLSFRSTDDLRAASDSHFSFVSGFVCPDLNSRPSCIVGIFERTSN
ncbi:hypothetical protein HY990_04280 [Candidatus Micrarchaeota archaeon]|nr:hypothetical protein [Candidatus Micrarchaeota archaeon]